MNTQTCPNSTCGASLLPDANFCSQCGKNLKANPQKIFFISIITVLIAATGYGVSSMLIGQKPVQNEQVQNEESAVVDPLIEALKAQAQAAPQDINRWKAVSEAIKAKLISSPEKNPSLIFDLIDSYRGILSINPKDESALLGMAEISYEQQAFDKASEFYAQYLTIRPEDLQTKANYASALSFAGKSDESIKELYSVLKSKPKDFQATAFLSIAFARKGDMKKAIEVGKEALTYAPDEEAKKRLTGFINSIEKNPVTQALPVEDKSLNRAGNPSVVESPKGKLLQILMEHPIVGPKIKSHEFKEDTLILTVENFPMSAMPENAKAAFQSRLSEKVKTIEGNSTKKIIFKDSVSGATLGEVVL